MTLEFYLHPNFAAQIDDFQSSEHVSVMRYPYNYNEAFSYGSLLVTDYSSVAFDFAYLRKPVLYAHFDYHEFFSQHAYSQGYFDYASDGFGQICHTYEEMLLALISSIKDGPEINSKYRERVDRFFRYHDTKSSERVYRKLLDI